MDKNYFAVRISNRTFEYSAGHGYVDSGGKPEEFVPLNKARWGLHLCPAGYIRDESGNVVGCNFKDCESGRITEVYPGKVYNISVRTTAVDDDGCPEDICIDFYVELIPWEE